MACWGDSGEAFRYKEALLKKRVLVVPVFVTEYLIIVMILKSQDIQGNVKMLTFIPVFDIFQWKT